MKRLLVLFTIILSLFTSAFAETLTPVSSSVEVKFFAKIMRFNTTISTLKVGVVFDPSSSTSVNSKKRILNLLSSYDISAIAVPSSAIDQAKENGITALYLSKGLTSVDYISRVARRDNIVTFASDSSLVEEGYASVSVGLSSAGKPKIVIHMSNLKKEGSMFSSKLLRLANIIQ